MKPKLILCLALVLSGGLFNFGKMGWCADEKAAKVMAKPEVAKSLNDLSASITKVFSNYIPSATMTLTNLGGTKYAPAFKDVSMDSYVVVELDANELTEAYSNYCAITN